jgi:hypothetical protein
LRKSEDTRCPVIVENPGVFPISRFYSHFGYKYQSEEKWEQLIYSGNIDRQNKEEVLLPVEMPCVERLM